MALTVDIDEVWEDGAKRHTRGTISTNNTTYATGGLDLPTKQEFGFRRQIDSLVIQGNDAGATTHYLIAWDKSAHKLLFYEEEAAAAGGPLLEEGAVALGSQTLTYHATGW